MSFHRFGQLAREWRELEEIGIPLEPPALRVGVNRNGGLTIRQERVPYERGIYELSSGRVAYVLPVFIRRNDPGKTMIRDWSLHVPWDDSVEGLENCKKPRGDYSFPGGSLKYPCGWVLNHRMHCILARGDIREGYLLAVGHLRPPETYRTGDMLPITLRLLDQWDYEASAIFKLQLERCRTFGKEIKNPRRGPLLSRRDRVVLASPVPSPPTGNREKNAEVVQRLSGEVNRDRRQHALRSGPGRSFANVC